MIVSIKENKFQILISTLLGFFYYRKTGDETMALALVLSSAFILRSIKIDSIIGKKFNKEHYLNFKTKAEKNQFCNSMFNAQAIASVNEKAKKWDESKNYLKALMKTKSELAKWNKKYQKNKDKI